MIYKKCILLLTEKAGRSRQIAGTLRVAGYEVTVRDGFDDVLRLGFTSEKTVEHFDLLVADVEPEKIGRLNAVRRLLAIDRMLLIAVTRNCREPYSFQGMIAYLYHPSYLKKAVKEMFSSIEQFPGRNHHKMELSKRYS